uniref:Uncharacterized protein n=1 Tax=Kalanchoe fedtschenkoi TaxID=63787 RepID=A0A7N0V7E1_KALFE
MSQVDVSQCKSQGEMDAVVRRSGNYKNCVCDHDYIQNSMKNDYLDVKYKIQAEMLMQQVGNVLRGVSQLTEQLEVVDDLQRLGLEYHFENEIKTLLHEIYGKFCITREHRNQTDLHTAALAFRLLRQHGHPVTQDIFKCFMDIDSGRFKLSLLKDIKGMISLYEASYHGAEGEGILGEAFDFTKTHLPKLNIIDPYLKVLVAHSLELPLLWRPSIAEARWFIEEAYEKNPKMLPVLLQLAKLDFNIVQGSHKEELRELSRWWTKLDFGKDLSFARDSLVASYIWGLYAAPQPQYQACREVSTKVIAIVSTVDDIYDVYGTLEELELFTLAFERWDTTIMEQLPAYMKKCFFALNKFVEELADDIPKEKGLNVVENLKMMWINQARAYLTEAQWYHKGHRPTLDEYMGNAWITMAVPLCAMHSYVVDTEQVTLKELKCLENDSDFMKSAGTIGRLVDDLGTSSDEMARGDVPKAIQCYMNDTGASEEAARNHVKDMVREEWKKLNKYAMENKTLPHSTVERIPNLLKGAHFFYMHGDGHGIQDKETKVTMSKLLFDPIPASDAD